MRTLKTLLLAAIALLTSACASTAANNAAQHPTSAVRPETALTTPLSMNADGVAASENRGGAETEAEGDFARPPVSDPWEGLNRKIHSFNNFADKFVLRPIAVGYERAFPEPVRVGVSRFFSNLKMPMTAVNQALQGRPGDAAQSVGRFAVNTTVGIVGLFDPASRVGLPEPDDEDFGQTLANWGWRDSRYLVVPLLGPRTLRDTVAIAGDLPLSPISHIQDSTTATVLLAAQVIDVRTRMLPVDTLRRDALDDYLFVRDAWAQQRNHQIQQNERNDRD